jgi:uncharacterized protein
VTVGGHRPGWIRLLVVLCGMTAASVAWADTEVIPASPAAHFNDYAGIVSGQTAQRLDGALDQFEKETSNQVVVVIYPTMQSDSSVEDYTVRVAQAWHAGLKGKDNGAVLFVFVDSHQLRIQVGYGLEAVLTDALCKEIISNEISPRFHSGDYDGGMVAGVNAIMAATRGEYHGSGSTVAGRRQSSSGLVELVVMVGFFLLVAVLRSRGSVYGSGGHGFVSGLLWGMLMSGGRSGGGGGFGGGGGGFSGGGGGFGGGGAGGSW